MRALNNRRILLGVTGGIACYKSAALARLLTQSGAVVDVAMTRSATQFVGETTFQALTGRAVHTDITGGADSVDHIRLAQRAELIVIAPATADFLARMVHGRADDLLAAAVLAARSRILVAPAMNDHMWSKAATQRNVAQLRADGVEIVDPETGPLAAGEGEGPGRMPEPDTLLHHIARMLTPQSRLKDMSVLVGAGSTREDLDPVRFISNRSSGKMGVALAAAAWRRGARVTLVAGAMSVDPPVGVNVVRVERTEEMAAAVRELLPGTRLLIMAAAPADFRPGEVSGAKIEKSRAPSALPLTATTDILLSTIDARSPACLVVGFALETGSALSRAREKLKQKRMDMIVVNDANEAGAGFNVDTNRVTLLRDSGEEFVLPLLPKDEVSELILDNVEEIVRVKG